jgi:nucleotide-binding universal stress UspA family protein
MPEILVAVSGSDYAEELVKFATNLASNLSYHVALIYVSKNPVLVEQYLGISETESIAKTQPFMQAAESVTSRLAGIVREEGVHVEVILETGIASERILAAAARRKSNMIAISLRALQEIDRNRTLGSDSKAILEEAPCPVIVVG